MNTNAPLIETALGPPSAERARGLITIIQNSNFPAEFTSLAWAIDAIRNGHLTNEFYEYIRIASEKITDPDLLRDLIEFVNNTTKGVSASNLENSVKQRAQSRLQLIVPILNNALQAVAQPAATNTTPSTQVTSPQENAPQADCTLPWVLFGVAAALCLLMLLVIVLLLVRQQREKSFESPWMRQGDRSSRSVTAP